MKIVKKCVKSIKKMCEYVESGKMCKKLKKFRYKKKNIHNYHLHCKGFDNIILVEEGDDVYYCGYCRR